MRSTEYMHGVANGEAAATLAYVSRYDWLLEHMASVVSSMRGKQSQATRELSPGFVMSLDAIGKDAQVRRFDARAAGAAAFAELTWRSHGHGMQPRVL